MTTAKTSSELVWNWLQAHGMTAREIGQIEKDRICDDLGMQAGTVHGCLTALRKVDPTMIICPECGGPKFYGSKVCRPCYERPKAEVEEEPALLVEEEPSPSVEEEPAPSPVDTEREALLTRISELEATLNEEREKAVQAAAELERVSTESADLKVKLEEAQADLEKADRQTNGIYDALFYGEFGKQPEAEPSIIDDFEAMGTAVDACIRRLTSEPYRKRTRSLSLPQWAQVKALELTACPYEAGCSTLMWASILEAAADACFLVAARRER